MFFVEGDIEHQIWEALIEFPKVDAHEHLLPQQTFRQNPDVLLSILQESYLPWICFGVRDLKKFNWNKSLLVETMRKIPASAFLKYLQHAFEFIYDFSGDLCREEDWQALREIVRQAYDRKDLVAEWLEERFHIKRVILDRYWVVNDYNLERKLFVPVLRIDPYFYGFSALARDHDDQSPYTEKEQKGKEIVTFEDYLKLIDKRMEEGIKQGVVALKCAIAYDRGLDFPCVSLERARVAFEREDGQESPEEILDFQNFVFHYFLQKAVDYDLPVQIHTGPGKYFRGAPFRLAPLFERYSSLKVSLLHGGFPWVGEPGAMAYFYPNLYLDLTWLPILSPTFSDLALTQWLEVTGGTRIMVGGDSWNVEGVVGAFLFSLASIARVLGRMVTRRYISKNQAYEIGKRILWDNPLEFFGARVRA
ncbi:amidohydrolase family protein [Thermatribacter velox]|uniref:Amidohydrolase family protein n=1 Tax=Thermatribacter velox TaxID=3039681 RepID=A0ABZ2YER3_9BACT